MKQLMYLTLLFIIIAAPLNLAQVPRLLNYQGVLSDASGNTVPDGNYDVTFRIYETQTAGSPLWEEPKTVTTSKGVFSVVLGSDIEIALSFNNLYWMGLSINAGPELSPRTLLTCAPYSFNSINAEMVNGIEANTTPTANNLLPLDNTGYFPRNIVPRIGMEGVSNDDLNIWLTSSTATEILNLPINVSGIKDVFITAHLVAEVGAIQTSKRYQFQIRRGSISGDTVATGWWRVTATTTGYHAETITFSAVDKDVSGYQTYYLVAKKFDSSASDCLVFIGGLNAIYIQKQ